MSDPTRKVLIYLPGNIPAWGTAEDRRRVLEGRAMFEMNPQGKVVPANGWRVKHGVRTHYVNGVVHHDTEPAYINKATGVTEWRRHGKRDRRDGPAVINIANGISEWWVDGKRLTVTSIEAYAKALFPEHTTELAVLSYIVHMGLPLEVQHMLRKLEQPNTDEHNV